MHAVTMVHRALSICCPAIHARRLTCLCDAAQAAARGNHLSLSELGRELPSASTRHNIKRIDRLLGNAALHDEISRALHFKFDTSP